MDKNIPAPALGLLSFIASFEAPRGYDTVYGNRMSQMPRPLTSMTLTEVIADGPRRTKLFGSSACGRYQFMTATLKDLQKSLVLIGNDKFTSDFQDRLGYELLKRRGYLKFVSGGMSLTAFGLGIAQEWASFPVLVSVFNGKRNIARGQSYYAGDGVNKALVRPEAVEAALRKVLAVAPMASVEPPPPPPVAPAPAVVAPDTRNVWQRMADRLRAAFPVQKA